MTIIITIIAGVAAAFQLCFSARHFRDRRRFGPIVTPALILTFLLLTLGNYTPKGIKTIIINLLNAGRPKVTENVLLYWALVETRQCRAGLLVDLNVVAATKYTKLTHGYKHVNNNFK